MIRHGLLEKDMHEQGHSISHCWNTTVLCKQASGSNKSLEQPQVEKKNPSRLTQVSMQLCCCSRRTWGSSVDRECVRRLQTGHFPSMQGAKVADSAILDSDDDDSYGCTRLVPVQGHSSSSASQRESSAESAQRT